MNNNQFRKLLFGKSKNDQNGSSADTTQQKAASSSLGGKKSSFMPMTPRTVKGGIDVDFARQVRERNATQKPAKKFNSYAPKGVKYAAGYTDRAKAREEGAGEQDDKGERIKALEEQMKLGQIAPETFEALRDQITGGDISNTHLVKGLDRQLLERVRRGENVLDSEGKEKGNESKEPEPDVEDELDKLGEKELETVKRNKAEKKGSMAPPSVAGVKRTRDEILAELKAQRKAAADAKAAAMMDGRWKKVGEKEKSRIEIDHKGREVLITVDEDGVVKKKVRKVAVKDPSESEEQSLDMPDASQPVLGADVVIPESKPVAEPAQEDDDDDIFEGVGTEYDPLGADDDDDDDDSDEDDDDVKPVKKTTSETETTKSQRKEENDNDENAAAEPPKPAAAPRNYFKDKAPVSENVATDRFAGIESVFKKAARMDPLGSGSAGDDDSEDKEARESRLKKRAQMLAQDDRDMDDMDMGFGSSRFEDEADAGGEGAKMRLSEWKGGDDGWEEDGKGDGKGDGKRKRKPKKRKGDVNNAADIMRVIDGRRAAGGK